jgi:type III secretory pathway component EscV
MRSACHPLTDQAASWIAPADWKAARRKGFALETPLDLFIGRVKVILEKNLATYLRLEDVFDLLQQHAPQLVAPLERRDAVSDFRRLLQCLVDEGVPITEFADLAAAYLRALEDERDQLTILQRLRELPGVRAQLPGNQGPRRIFRIGDDFADIVREALVTIGAGTLLALTPEDHNRLIESVRCHREGESDENVVAVTPPELRRAIRKLFETEFWRIQILSETELLSYPGDEEEPELDVD